MEYLDLVSQIIAAEQSAKEIAREAREQEGALEENLAREIEEMRAKYRARAKRRIAEVERTEAIDAQEALDRLERRRAEAMAKVESAYAGNRDAWAEVLFRRIVGDPA